MQGLEEIDTFATLDLQLTDGFVEGLFSFCFGGVFRRQTVGVVVVDGFEGRAPGSEGFLFVVLAGVSMMDGGCDDRIQTWPSK